MPIVALAVLVAALLAASAASPAEARLAVSFGAGGFAAPRSDSTQETVATGQAGRLVVVPGKSTRSGRGPLRRYYVEVETGIRIDRRWFARRVHQILADRRSWGGTGRVSFQRVGLHRTAHFRVTLATPSTTDRLCFPYITGGIYSCANGGRAVLNLSRWRRGADAYRRNLRGYRIYLVQHEVGHLLGHPHRYCPRAGARAPVMMQQTKGVGSCRANPWPLPWERG
ncbi:MAG: DUF3152 domain-containing protein [Gaiellaceae bacterium]